MQVVSDGSASVVDGMDYGAVYVTPLNALTSFTMTSNVSAGSFSELVYYYATYGYLYVIGANGPGENKLLPGVWVNFDISAGALPEGSVIEISMGGFSNDVTVVPKPMTIGLLSLGALMLRRKRS